MKRAVPLTLAAIFCFAALVPVFAHHGFQAEYDGKKLIYVTGTLTKQAGLHKNCFQYHRSLS